MVIFISILQITKSSSLLMYHAHIKGQSMELSSSRESLDTLLISHWIHTTRTRTTKNESIHLGKGYAEE